MTDYKPDTRGGEQVLEPVNKRKLLFSLNNASVLPMMDRNLGAMAGYVDEAPTSFVEMSKTNGFHYQWGRKDPFPSSYTTKKISVINNKNSSTPPEGMLNRYAEDGITYVVNGGQSVTRHLAGSRLYFMQPVAKVLPGQISQQRHSKGGMKRINLFGNHVLPGGKLYPGLIWLL